MVRETEMKFEDDEVYSIEESASGKNAMYLDYCDVVWHRPGYASCLHKMEDREKGRLEVRFEACSAAIGRKTCPALRLRAEEVAKGQAIHFINRVKLMAFNQYQQEMGGQAFFAAVSSDNIRKAKRPAKTQEMAEPRKPFVQEKESIPESGYAAAINAALARETATPAVSNEVVSSAPKTASLGLSMLEMARLKLNNKGVSNE